MSIVQSPFTVRDTNGNQSILAREVPESVGSVYVVTNSNGIVLSRESWNRFVAQVNEQLAD